MKTNRSAFAVIPIAAASLLFACETAHAKLIAGVDFEGATQSVFDRNPDDYDLDDGITVSSGTASPMFDGWTLLLLNGDPGASGNLRNDNGANSAGATTPDYPARLEGARTGSWSITIPAGVVLNLDRVEFDVRAATNGSGRDGFFNTSLDGGNYLWEDLNLPGRTTGNWQRITVDLSGGLYQGLTDQTVSFIWTTSTSGAIDLDTIEVHGAVGGTSPAIQLAITPNGSNPGDYDFSWDSLAGKVYDLVSATDLAAGPETWPVWDGRVDIPSAGTTTTLAGVPGGGDPARFFAVVEKDPPPLFSEDFESSDGGFTLKVAGGGFTPAGSPWEHGDPDSTSPGGAVDTGNGGSTNCWGTNLGLATDGHYAVPTETCLRSAVIDLTGVAGAALTFAEALDLEGGDTAVVNVIEEATDTVILSNVYSADDSIGTNDADWRDVPAIDLTPAVGRKVRIEWCFSGATSEYMGWYIDDVTVTETTP